MAAILDFSLYSILHRREDRWKFILGRKYVRKKSTRSINLEMFKEADIIIAMHVIGFQMTFKLSIWPLRTLYDICSHLQHQNRVHWPRKWLETCVTRIYYDVIYLPYDRFNKMAAILDFSLHSIFHSGEDRWKLILGKKNVGRKSKRSIKLVIFK